MTILRFATVIVFLMPLHAQPGEIYGLVGYAHAPSRDASSIGMQDQNGISYGAGIGRRIVSILGIEGEFHEYRGSGGFGPDSSFVYTGGGLNLLFEKPRGKFRPDFVAGVGGGSLALRFPTQNMYATFTGSGRSVEHYSTWTALFGGGAALLLTERVFVRPQIRYQLREQFNFWGGGGTRLPSPLSLCVGVGYRF